MPKILEEWTVLPHGRLNEIDDGILTVTGKLKMPLTELERRMTVVRLKDQRLVVFSAIALDEPQMRRLETFGTPAFLVVPGDHHRTDARIWKDRYPQMRVIAPEGARDAVTEAVPVDATTADFNDPEVSVVTVPGTHDHEAALIVRRPSGTTLIVNDLIGNLHNQPGFSGLVLGWLGFAGKTPHVPSPVKPGLPEDRAALRRQLLAWADDLQLKRIIVSHGEPIEDAPAETLRKLAASLP